MGFHSKNLEESDKMLLLLNDKANDIVYKTASLKKILKEMDNILLDKPNKYPIQFRKNYAIILILTRAQTLDLDQDQDLDLDQIQNYLFIKARMLQCLNTDSYVSNEVR